jgi:hypothetical protein
MNSTSAPYGSVPTPLRQFIQYAVTAPSADNSQPWAFELEDGLVVCRYQHAGGGIDPFGPMGHGTLIAAGALQENIDRLLAMLDMPPSVKRLNSAWSIAFNVPDQMLQVSEALDAMLCRHTNRFPYRRIKLPDFSNLPSSSSNLTRTVVVEDRETIRCIGNAVKACAEVRFNIKDLHEWLFSSFRWNQIEVQRGDGLDLSTVPLPAGGRQFMRFISPWSRMLMLNKLGLYKILAAIDSVPVYKAPCIVALVGFRSAEGAWDAGRLLQSLWIALNGRGYAVHPYYVITDLVNRLVAGRVHEPWRQSIASAKLTVEGALGLSAGEQVHMLLRVGESSSDTPRSLRRSVEGFLPLV